MRTINFLSVALSLLVPAAAAAQDFEAVEIHTIQVSDSIYMLIGQGGKRDGRWVELVAVLDQRCRHRVSWKELSDPKLWRSGWQQLPDLEDGEGVS